MSRTLRPAPRSVTLLIGPEGGWSSGEVAAARLAGYRGIQLGALTLRAELAPTVALKSPTIPVIDCPGAMATRLKQGQLVRVTFTDGTPLRLRQAANKTSKTLGTIPEGGTMKIEGGPQCSEKGIWWQVKLTKAGTVGWVLEGENGSYFLEPAP